LDSPGSRIGILNAEDVGAYLPFVRTAHAQDKVVAATADIRVTARGLLPATVRVVSYRPDPGGRSDELPDQKPSSVTSMRTIHAQQLDGPAATFGVPAANVDGVTRCGADASFDIVRGYCPGTGSNHARSRTTPSRTGAGCVRAGW
jgi:hypothetical protein